jgi:predicted MPP superfamily phosphohydrolase
MRAVKRTFPYLLVTVLSLGVIVHGRQAPQGETPFAITHGPYLQLPSATSMTIACHTNRPAVVRVEYGEGGRLDQTAISVHHGLIDNDRTSHVVRLEGLRPGVTYFYRVVLREFSGYEKQYIVHWGATVTSETLHFTTLDPAAARYSFAVVSDIHENAKRLDTLLEKVDWKAVPFVVFNGDMVNDFMDVNQPFTGFLDTSVARFAQRIPFVYVRGNHDVRGRFARRLEDYFPTEGGHAYYSFDHGPVHFVVLDSGEDKVDTHEYYNGLTAFEPYRREQAEWLARDLSGAAAKAARFRVILSHIPPDGAEGFAIRDVRAAWHDIASRGGVELWLSGHTHRYLNLDPAPGRNPYRLVIGAPDTITLVDVSAAQLHLTVTRETGEVLGEATVRSVSGSTGQQ